MKHFKVSQISLTTKISFLAGLVILSILAYFTATQDNVRAAPILLIDDKVLEEKAIAEAQTAGLQGVPAAKRSVHMTLAEWLQLNDAELGKNATPFGLTPDMPVYVLAIRGNVLSQLPIFPQPGQARAQEQYDNITIVLDAKTGNLIWVVATRSGFPMPVSVP